MRPDEFPDDPITLIPQDRMTTSRPAVLLDIRLPWLHMIIIALGTRPVTLVFTVALLLVACFGFSFQ